MFDTIKKIFLLLDDKQRFKLYLLQIFILAMAFFEVFTLSLIGPFFSIVNDPDFLKAGNFISQVYTLLDYKDPYNFIFNFGAFILFVLLLSSCLSMWTVWQISLYSQRIGADFSVVLYNYYLHRSWIFHSNTNSSYLIKQVANETSRVTGSIIFPIMQLISKLFVVLVILIFLIIVNPLPAVLGVSVFGLAYFVIFKIIRQRLSFNGTVVSLSAAERYKLLNEGFSGILDIKILNRYSYYVNKFRFESNRFALSQGANIALSQIPRFFIEFLAISAVICTLMFVAVGGSKEVENLLPIIAVYGFAGLKLLPYFQQIYANVSQIRSHYAAFESIEDDLYGALEEAGKDSSTSIDLNESLEMDSVYFKYPGANYHALKNVSLKIKRPSFVAFVGESGSGKSTILKVILGLLKCNEGSFKIDGRSLTVNETINGAGNLGYVPQKVFLADDSIANNIAFGVPDSDIDVDKLNRSIKFAQLESFIESLPDGLMSHVGEDGVQLSGGQLQRIGIARALYHSPKILILDEATSALDTITERSIMASIKEFSNDMLVIAIAHRLSTVENCDEIFFMESGEVLDTGTFSDLLAKNAKFRRMALVDKD